MTRSTTTIIIGGIIAFVLFAAVAYSALSAWAQGPVPEFPEQAVAIANDIQAKSTRVAEINAELARLTDERDRATASAHSLDRVLCADYGLVYQRGTASGDMLTPGRLSKSDCDFQ